MMNNKRLDATVEGFKLNADTGIFECYGNTKGNIDHALDRAVDGCYSKSINDHKVNGTVPKMFWMHNPFELPVGTWTDMAEDAKGLYLRGKLSKTAMGRDIEILAKDNALNMFSIGYREVQSKWNNHDGCNDLIEVDLKEISWVNFACNEESRLETIKHNLVQGGLPTKRELEETLREQLHLSKREAARIVDHYNPTGSFKNLITEDIADEMAELARIVNS